MTLRVLSRSSLLLTHSRRRRRRLLPNLILGDDLINTEGGDLLG